MMKIKGDQTSGRRQFDIGIAVRIAVSGNQHNGNDSDCHHLAQNSDLFLIDADKIKSINDIHGHIQGDQALVRIAEALRLACRNLPGRANIARYGGDEFVILAETDKPENLCTQIRERLSEINARDPVPYELTVSIGVTKVEIGMSMADAIAKADQKMYQEKRR